MADLSAAAQIVFKLLEEFFSQQKILDRLDQTAALQAQLQAVTDDIKTKCEAYNKQQSQASGDVIFIARLDCNDPVAVVKIFPEAVRIDEIKTEIEKINTPPDYSAITTLLKLISASMKKGGGGG